MSPLRVAYLDFWRGFEPRDFVARFPELAEAAASAGGLATVTEPARADLVVFSCFPDGRKTHKPRDPHAWADTSATRLFYTGENVDPSFATCDFAMSFRRDLDHPNHLRVPNYVATQRAFGFAPDALLSPPAEAAAIRRSKTRFCTYVQRNRVPIRERFVEKLSAYKQVDCAGPSLNNTGFVANRERKYELYRESKFAVCFENEAEVGYTTEKLPDALLTDCVPLYWGDPTVHQDFDADCFVHLRDFPSMDAMIERIIELDRDDEAYDAMLGARRYPGRDGLPPAADPMVLGAFFWHVLAAAVGGRLPRSA